jgi:hypothetical protein
MRNKSHPILSRIVFNFYLNKRTYEIKAILKLESDNARMSTSGNLPEHDFIENESEDDTSPFIFIEHRDDRSSRVIHDATTETLLAFGVTRHQGLYLVVRGSEEKFFNKSNGDVSDVRMLLVDGCYSAKVDLALNDTQVEAETSFLSSYDVNVNNRKCSVGNVNKYLNATYDNELSENDYAKIGVVTSHDELVKMLLYECGKVESSFIEDEDAFGATRELIEKARHLADLDFTRNEFFNRDEDWETGEEELDEKVDATSTAVYLTTSSATDNSDDLEWYSKKMMGVTELNCGIEGCDGKGVHKNGLKLFLWVMLIVGAVVVSLLVTALIARLTCPPQPYSRITME